MIKNNFLFVVCFIFILHFSLSSESSAQRTCETTETEHFLKNKDHIAGSEAFENKIKQVRANIAEQKRREQELQKKGIIAKTNQTESTYKIPVIVHVIHNGEAIGEGTNISAEQIYGQIEVLNEDFNFRNPDRDETLDIFKDVADNPSIEFVMATVDPEGRPLDEVGIHRAKGCLTTWSQASFNTYVKPNTVWNPNLYFNIWVANYTKLGYAQFPVFSDLDGIKDENGAANTDGIVVRYKSFGSIKKTPNIPQLIEGAPFNEGRTTTHEVGHFFGLMHTWGDENLSCASDDFCEDTPNTKVRQSGCNLNEEACVEGEIIMSQNFMDYTDDRCMTLFTKDQVERMHAVLDISPRRGTLLDSDVAEPLGKNVFAIFETSKNRVIKGGNIMFDNQSLATGGATIQGYEWTFDGGTPTTSIEKSPTITYNQTGKYWVTLKVIGDEVSDKYKVVQIEVIDDNIVALNQTSLNFEDRNFEREGWSFERSDITNWRISSNGAYGTSNFSVYAPNATFRACETELSFISPFINIPSNRTVEISFDVAYGFDEDKLPDSLEISYSTDAGDKFKTLWKKGGYDIRTAVNQKNTFTPSSSQWKSYKLYLEVEGDSRFIQFKFQNIGANNNNLYLDNLQIRQATDLQAPVVDFDISYPLLLLSETGYLYSQSEFGVDFTWTVAGNTNLQTTGISPQINFTQEGLYDVTLQVSNTIATKERTESDAIKVVEGSRVTNISPKNVIDEEINGKALAGHDEQATIHKAEFFNGLGVGRKLYAVDIFFADADISNPNETFDVVLWSVDNDGKPSEELYRQNVSYSLIEKDIFERKQFTRVVLDEPQSIPNQIFAGVALEYESGNTFSIFTEKKQEGKGWEQKSNNDWLAYSTSRGQNYSNAISIVVSPEGVLGTDNNLDDQIKLYPNPNNGNFQLETQNIGIESVEVYNSIGQRVYQKAIPNAFLSTFEIQLHRPSNGMYLVKIQTHKGVITRKIIIQN
ncbi:M43 family zinc metalloprotease [Bernardetia sp.]|uniref:M43 family zinc metalloprotease n=1 Tax=Bernardetia sp. TaxID=1937974 RepID=UPI0025C1EAA0|nr:M43 family zinc metalloprotease [Bernardetia sp.]